LREAFHRVDAQGELCRRIILEPEMRSKDGAGESWGPGVHENGHMGLGMGASWEAIDPFLKQVIIDMTYQRREEDRIAGRPLLTVGFYTNAVCNGMPGMIRNHTSTDCLNLDNDHDLENFKRNWLPWVECGVLSELNYDAGVHNWLWPKVKNLLDDQMDRYGLYGMTESIKWDDNGGTPPNRYTWAKYQIPMWCISRYLLSRDPEGKLEFDWDGGDRVWTMSSPHTYWGGTSGLLTVEQALDYRRRGFGVGSWHLDGDSVVNLADPIPDPVPPGNPIPDPGGPQIPGNKGQTPGSGSIGSIGGTSKRSR